MELAVGLPMLATLVFGAITASNAIFVRHGIATASYEAAQVASAFGGTSESAKRRGTQVLEAYNVADYSIVITPEVSSDTTPMTPIAVTVSAPLASNTYGVSWLFPELIVRNTTTMSRL